jgi:hypothetical protein
MREFDDKLIYTLNNSLPTESMKERTNSNPEVNCQKLFEKLKSNYFLRQKLLENCIVLTAEQVSDLKKQHESSHDTQLERKFKSEQRKVISIKHRHLSDGHETYADL